MELCDQYIYELIHELIQLVPELNDFHQLPKYSHLRPKFTNTLTKDFQRKERDLLRKYHKLVKEKKQKSFYDLIILDDLLPKSESQEYTPRKTNSFWSGDVWKVSVELMTSNNLNFCIANIFPGIGILKKGQNYSYNKMNEKLNNMRFNDFMKYYKELPIVDCETAFKFIEKKV